MAERHDQQGTGRHGHKDTQEPWPHTKENERQGSSHGRQHDSSDDRRSKSHGAGSKSTDSSRSQEHRGSDASDLKEREYRGEDGEIHHHTRTYMEQHKGEKGRDDDRRGERGGGSHGKSGSERR